MKIKNLVRSLSLSLALVGGGAVFAQVNINISLAPPAPSHEAVPALSPGYVWAPGYWAWSNDRYVWVRGRSMVQRTGYLWQPDRWEQRNGTYYRQTGHWVRDTNVKPVSAQQMEEPRHDDGRHHEDKKDKKEKKDKKDKKKKKRKKTKRG